MRKKIYTVICILISLMMLSACSVTLFNSNDSGSKQAKSGKESEEETEISDDKSGEKTAEDGKPGKTLEDGKLGESAEDGKPGKTLEDGKTGKTAEDGKNDESAESEGQEESAKTGEDEKSNQSGGIGSQAVISLPDEKKGENMKDIVFASSTPEEAIAFADGMKAGWNLGNTLDAWVEGQHNSLSTERSWGNPTTTKDMITKVKEAGFTTIRIPVSWHNHATLTSDGGLKIDEEWLGRVKEVVDYAYDNDLYVIINIHHDNEPEGKYGYLPDNAGKEQALWYVSEVWTQVADYFKDYDEHLIFETLNEPRLTNDDAHEWWFEENDSHCKEAAEIINELNQEAIDIIRTSGGNNADRYVMIPGYGASIRGLNTDLFKLPEDPASYKLMISLHAYVPYDFALNPDMSIDKFNKSGAATDIKYLIDTVNRKFISKGIPVVLGEFGAREKNGNTSERIEYYKFYVKKCSDNGIPCVVWDNNLFDSDGERFGLFDRKALNFRYPEIVDAIVSSY